MDYLNLRVEENTGKAANTSIRLLSTATDAQILTLVTAIRAVILGNLTSAQKSIAVAGFVPDAGAVPVGAQRGQKWLIRGDGADGDSYSFTVGTADSTDIATPGSDIMDITAGDGLALTGAVEAVWADEGDGAMTVSSVEYRNYTLQ